MPDFSKWTLTELQILTIMLTRGTEEQVKEAFNTLGFVNSMCLLAHFGRS